MKSFLCFLARIAALYFFAGVVVLVLGTSAVFVHWIFVSLGVDLEFMKWGSIVIFGIAVFFILLECESLTPTEEPITLSRCGWIIGPRGLTWYTDRNRN